MHHQWCSAVTEHLAQQIPDPSGGDLVFFVPKGHPKDSDQKFSCFTAWKHILAVKGSLFLDGTLQTIPLLIFGCYSACQANNTL